jgi:alanyl-tRNA synthetase
LLPKPNIDTGMGLERIVAAVQSKDNVYETDLFSGLISLVSEMTGSAYGVSAETDKALRIVTEHGRCVSFLVADGVLPTNDGRGYVLRRLLRRAALYGRRLGLTEPFLAKIAEEVIKEYGPAYPELVEHRDLVLHVIQAEEERFMATLETGMGIVEDLIERAVSRGKDSLDGADVFRLYDTYGFPRELTAEVARERGLTMDVAGFEAALDKQRGKARAAHGFHSAEDLSKTFADMPSTMFEGHGTMRCESLVIALRQDGVDVSSVETGGEVDIILNRTPFYGEMGGQVGDTGRIASEDVEVEVHTTVRTASDVTVHRGRVVRGAIATGDHVVARVEEGRRLDVARNHTATHLLHAALRSVLGEQVAQRGSLVEPERLRFDFSWMGAIDKARIEDIEKWVNESIRADFPVTTGVESYQDAVEDGSIALFDEKYGDSVRVVRVGNPPVSSELCGGTHVSSTGQIGMLLILSEGSVGTGLRRIEAVTGRKAEALARERTQKLDAVAAQIGGTAADLLDRVGALLEEMETGKRRIASLERQLAHSSVDSLAQQATDIGGVPVVTARVDGLSTSVLREMGDSLRAKLGESVIVLASVENDRPSFLVMVSQELTGRGLHAGEIAKRAARATGGGGGGKPTMAQAGGKDVEKLMDAFAEARLAIKEKLAA